MAKPKNKRGYLPKDCPTERQIARTKLSKLAFGKPQRAQAIGQDVWSDVFDGLPQWVQLCLEQYPSLLDLGRKACVVISGEEMGRMVLSVNGKRMAGLRSIRIQDGNGGTLYVKLSQLALNLDENRAIVARYDNQIAALDVERASSQFCLDIHELHPEVTCGEALQLEGIQVEMVFEDVG